MTRILPASLALVCALLGCPETGDEPPDASAPELDNPFDDLPPRDPTAPALSAGTRGCPRVGSVEWRGWFGVDLPDEIEALGAGAVIAGQPMFPVVDDPGTTAALVMPDAELDPFAMPRTWEPTYVVSSGRTVSLPFAPAMAPMGSALLYVDQLSDPPAVTMLDPIRRRERSRASLPPGFAYSATTIAPRAEGSVLTSSFGLAYLGSDLRLEGDDFALSFGAPPRALRTDRGLLLFGEDSCGVVTIPLDEQGAPTAGTLCVAMDFPRLDLAIWDGGRVVIPDRAAVVELDAEGRLASRTVLPDEPLAAFGTDGGVVVLVRSSSRPDRVDLRLVERSTGRTLRELGASEGGSAPYDVLRASAAVAGGVAWLVFQIEHTHRLDPIRVICD